MKLTTEELARRNRLKTVLKTKNIDRQTFANVTGRTIGYIQQVLSGNGKVTEGLLNRLTKKYNDINADWILAGTGEPIYLANRDATALTPPEIEERGTVSHLLNGDLFEGVRALLVEYEKRIKALETEVGALRQEMKKG